ncbi:hypothetical protein DZC75_11510 [Pseudomonas parafulva]|uniref:BIG2 domain-containing protein n=1 Tax=Pseudomonas parafulva TaxID=157782 RepID=A0AAI8PBN3_9PSED|nr:Ig-like domain-containing protein [Pseudomonas parafulva]AIZ32985.1 hypothetical protein NJ69_08260 [Pseudomonas parafulva]AXO88591.1 hypothetical protein DZC75_11510 [Pseudomonas parafulva]
MNDLTVPAVALVQDGKLDPLKIPSTGLPVVMTVSAAHARDVLNLVLEMEGSGQRLYTSANLPIGASGRPVTLRIPKQLFLDHVADRLTIYYTLAAAGSSPSIAFEVEQGFSGDHQVDLSRHLYRPLYANGQVRLPKTLPGFVYYERTLPGATAYTSSDPSVATVTQAGRVTLLRNGQSTITAQTPQGAQSYSLTVTGIRGLEVLSTSAVTWQNAKNLCDSLGMSMPQERDFRAMVEYYGADLPQALDPRAPLWGESLGAGTAVTLNPVTLKITAESTQANNLRQVVGID